MGCSESSSLGSRDVANDIHGVLHHQLQAHVLWTLSARYSGTIAIVHRMSCLRLDLGSILCDCMGPF